MPIDKNESSRCLILTAASPLFADALVGLIGSLNCNWPDHPPVRVYDLGLESYQRAELEAVGLDICSVPPFCAHWRKHFTWKIWACHEAPCDAYLWLDAGMCVLRPMPEIFSQIASTGYFAVPNGLMVGAHMTPGLQRNLKLNADILEEMPSLSGGVHGFQKAGRGSALLDEALDLSRCEENLKATARRQFHEQTLLSVLLHRYFAPVFWADRIVYGADQGGIVSEDQRLWCHRRALQPEDLAYFRGCLRENRPPRIPTVPARARTVSRLLRLRIRIAKLRGRYPVRDHAETVYDGFRDS